MRIALQKAVEVHDRPITYRLRRIRSRFSENFRDVKDGLLKVNLRDHALHPQKVDLGLREAARLRISLEALNVFDRESERASDFD